MSTVTSPASVDRDLAAIVGDGNVKRTDLEINGVVPAAVVYPGSADEVGAILHLANERDLVVAPAGGLTKQQIGCVPERIDILLSTTRLNKVEEYDPGDLTIAVQAGMPFAQMQRQLGEHQQWVPCDAASLEHATIGGLLATGAAGPLKSTFGHMRDFCIGIQFVTADGKVVKGGGRVVKNVAGYDLMKLLTGSYGSLAVITRANFKVFPRPRQTRTFACSFHSLEEALQFRTRLFQSPLTPMCMEIVSPGASEYLQNQGTGARSRPLLAGAACFIACGGVADCAARNGKRQRAGPLCPRAGFGSHAHPDRRGRRAVLAMDFALRTKRAGSGTEMPWCCTRIWPSRMLVRRCRPCNAWRPDYNMIPAAVGRAATGNLVLALMPLAVDPPSAMQYANCVSAFRGMLPPGSSAEVAYCPTEAKPHFDIWGTTPTDVNMMRAVKRAIDPKNILNRGRFIV